MLVYGHRSSPRDVAPFLREFRAWLDRVGPQPDRDAIVDLIVDFAEVESAVADTLNPDDDDERTLLAPWREALRSLTDAFCASCAGGTRGAAAALARARTSLSALSIPPGCERVETRAAEGFSCFALYPEQYVDAARRVRPTIGDAPVVCLGLRSIGSVLASTVASALAAEGCRTSVRSVRPRGHPFDRTLKLGPQLSALLSSHAASHFLIVDEGPGMSGSSFASAVDALTRLGVPSSRITLLPAWQPDPRGLRSARAQSAFSACRVVVGASPVRDVVRDVLGRSAVDVSAGLWRSAIASLRGTPVAVHPQHERVKFVDSPMQPRLTGRFAGLGRHGRIRFERAQRLHAAGFGPEPVCLSRGFLVLRWIDGTPFSAGQPLTPAGLDRVAAYIAAVARERVPGEADDGHELDEMVRFNTITAFGEHFTRPVEALLEAREWSQAPRCAVDGRMLPHEWIDSGNGLMKVDALDHHADDFLPGCRDVAWDVAGACVEMTSTPHERERLVGQYVLQSGDAGVVQRLPFFTTAYLAWRVGYTTMAAESLGRSDDGTRFSRAAARYRRLLAAHVAPTPRVAAR